jgi:photosystem II stability/assembly factor-like uncharacterized protein
MRKLILFVLILVSLPIYAQFGWYRQNANSTNLVGGVHMFNDNKAIVVGFNGLVRTTTNGGTNWALTSVGISSNLHKVTFMNDLMGVIIGELGIILYTSNGGASWNSTGSVSNNLNDVRYVEVGGEASNTAYIAGTNGLILKSTNGGLNWNSLNSGTTQMLNDVSFADFNTGFVCGINGIVLKTTNGGVNWTPKNTGLTDINNYGIRFLNKDTGIVVGGSVSFNNGCIFKTTNGGTTWTVKLLNYFGSINMPYYHDANTITVVGNYGVILRSYDGGNSWTIQGNQSNEYLHDVDFSNSSVGIAVGKNGAIVKTTSGGLVNVSLQSTLKPESFSLKQNYPNPFNPATKISFDIKNSTFASLKIFDMSGKEIKALVDENLAAGSYEINFNASELNSGVYFYTLKTNEYTETKKMMLVK